MQKWTDTYMYSMPHHHNVISHSKISNSIFLHSLSLYYSMWYKQTKVSENLTFILKQSLVLLSVCVIIVVRPISAWIRFIVTCSYSFTATTNTQNNCYCYTVILIPWQAFAIYNYANMPFVIQVKWQKIWLLFWTKFSFCQVCVIVMWRVGDSPTVHRATSQHPTTLLHKELKMFIYLVSTTTVAVRIAYCVIVGPIFDANQ